jgi:hypothetical protein
MAVTLPLIPAGPILRAFRLPKLFNDEGAEDWACATANVDTRPKSRSICFIQSVG